MLYRPVYLKGTPTITTRTMHESLIPMGRPPPVPPPVPPVPIMPEPPAALVEEQVEEEEPEAPIESEEDLKRLPLLIARYRLVIPHEATRDVLSGRVPYLLVENGGTTLFRPVHMFAALKLNKGRVELFRDFSCLGAHERVLEKKTHKRVGLGYRRKYISPELIGRGIYQLHNYLHRSS